MNKPLEMLHDLPSNLLQEEIVVMDSATVEGSSLASEEFHAWHDEEEDDLVEEVPQRVHILKNAKKEEVEDIEEVEYVEYVDPAEQSPSKSKKKGRERAMRPVTMTACEVCGVVLKHPSRIAEHMRTHTGEKPFECDICGKRFSQRTPMVNHYREHLGDYSFVCGYGCGKRFVNNARKNAHELRHLGLTRQGRPRPHLKPPKRLIDQTFDTVPTFYMANLQSSLSLQQEEKQMVEILVSPSEMNGMQLVQEVDSPNRKRTSSSRIEEIIASVVAGCTEEQRVIVEKPARSYNTERAVTFAQCTICGLMLKHPSKIKQHMSSHEGFKPYKCGECGQSFTRPTSLKLHIRRKHTGDRPYPCRFECGKEFVCAASRNEHEKIVHAEVKRYQCNVKGCERLFTRRAYLMSHRASQHPDIFTSIFDPAAVIAEEKKDLENAVAFTEPPETEVSLQPMFSNDVDGDRSTNVFEGEFVDETVLE
ncbi:unnamed protein product [Caenorhabditis auriculariae]|uniref:C2H2-type domain-containing protein n=1 Tax=Caenorhabditis auriculariae TaxID=2777116 RepID=A0A8S1GSQ0_9PELO|nr:unnamed protein product [Caenorhabditis auriculariae]